MTDFHNSIPMIGAKTAASDVLLLHEALSSFQRDENGRVNECLTLKSTERAEAVQLAPPRSEQGPLLIQQLSLSAAIYSHAASHLALGRNTVTNHTILSQSTRHKHNGVTFQLKSMQSGTFLGSVCFDSIPSNNHEAWKLSIVQYIADNEMTIHANGNQYLQLVVNDDMALVVEVGDRVIQNEFSSSKWNHVLLIAILTIAKAQCDAIEFFRMLKSTLRTQIQFFNLHEEVCRWCENFDEIAALSEKVQKSIVISTVETGNEVPCINVRFKNILLISIWCDDDHHLCRTYNGVPLKFDDLNDLYYCFMQSSFAAIANPFLRTFCKSFDFVLESGALDYSMHLIREQGYMNDDFRIAIVNYVIVQCSNEKKGLALHVDCCNNLVRLQQLSDSFKKLGATCFTDPDGQLDVALLTTYCSNKSSANLRSTKSIFVKITCDNC